MSRKPLKLLQFLRRLPGRGFARAEGGNIAIWTAASVLPIALFVGAATDFRRVEMARSTAQDAADAAVLAAAKSYLADGRTGEGKRRKAAEAAVEASLKANLEGRDAVIRDLRWDLEVGEGGREFNLLTRARMPAAFGALFGISDLPVRVASSASLGMKRAEVALVLDNTGSMYGRKLDTLKTSAADLVDRLGEIGAERNDPRAMRIALVPFSMTVNVGAKYASADWIDHDARSPVHRALFTTSQPVNRFELLASMKETWAGCVENRPYPHDVRESEPSRGDPETLYVPYFAPDEPGNGATAGQYSNDYLPDVVNAPDEATLQGNVEKYVAATPRTGSSTTGYAYGPNAGCHLTQLVPLTHERAAVKTGIANMKAVGDTNIPMGLMWGWHALSPKGPLADAVDYRKSDTVKIAILMTDGQNNVTPVSNHNGALYSGVGYMGQLGVKSASTREARRAVLDERLGELCANMKRRGVVIYTIRVEVNEGSDEVLRTCASKPSGFFNVQNVSELPGVFNTIADSITGLRLSR